MTIRVHRGDLPEGLLFGDSVAIDTEAMGLNPHRDRLCLVQLSAGDGVAHLVKLEAGAARVIEDDAFDAAALLDVATLLEDAHAHLGMSAAARALGRPGAADAVARLGRDASCLGGRLWLAHRATVPLRYRSLQRAA